MALFNMRDMLTHAHQHGYAIAAFDLVSLDFLEAIIKAAESCRAPVILSLAESHFEYFDFELAMAATEAAAKRTWVPVAIHLDHGASLQSAVAAIGLGCNGVMVDASTLALDDNIARTKAVVDTAHACGVPVEGELGYVAGVEGEDAEKHPGELVYTSPQEAALYVERSGVDFLAVSIGTVHGRMRGEPQLDFDRLESINETLGIPLVIHGGTGLSDDQFLKLIERGVSKINYFTALADAAADQIRSNLSSTAAGGSYTTLLGGIQAPMQAEMERCIRLWGSADRAAELSEACEPWRPVDHLIIYNVSDDADVATMITEGRRVLGAIPGVREVFAGKAVRDDAGYRYCWNVRFCHPNVIDSYREHPDHVAFADNRFRPVAGDRISTDFLEVY
jgi:fructose-bisphosphate aldolase class II